MHGHGIAGICLIRLGDVRPAGFPPAQVDVNVAAHRADMLAADSVFDSMNEASAFLRCAPLGYAATPAAGVFDGVALATPEWAIAPLHLDQLRSSMSTVSVWPAAPS